MVFTAFEIAQAQNRKPNNVQKALPESYKT